MLSPGGVGETESVTPLSRRCPGVLPPDTAHMTQGPHLATLLKCSNVASEKHGKTGSFIIFQHRRLLMMRELRCRSDVGVPLLHPTCISGGSWFAGGWTV